MILFLLYYLEQGSNIFLVMTNYLRSWAIISLVWITVSFMYSDFLYVCFAYAFSAMLAELMPVLEYFKPCDYINCFNI